MSKIKEVMVGASYTYQPAAYHSIKGEAHYLVEIEDGDDVDAVQDDLRQQLVNSIVHTLARVDEVHMAVHKKGFDPKDLLTEEQPVEDEDDEWK